MLLAELLFQKTGICSVAASPLGLDIAQSLHCFNKWSDAATIYISLVVVLECDLSPGFVQGEAYNCTAQEEPHAGIVGITIPSLLATLLQGS